MDEKTIECIDWGVAPYQEAWERQKAYFQACLDLKNARAPVPNRLFLCEHPPVFTLGKSAKMSNLLVSQERLAYEGIELHAIERGGDITFHGLGQFVGYPILDLDNFGLGARAYVWHIEQAIIELLADFGIEAGRVAGASGVWVGEARKICAIGIKCSRMITMHGFALNVNTDLRYFDYMIPCGIQDKGVTSMAQEAGKPIDMTEVKARLPVIFERVFRQSYALQA